MDNLSMMIVANQRVEKLRAELKEAEQGFHENKHAFILDYQRSVAQPKQERNLFRDGHMVKLFRDGHGNIGVQITELERV